MQTIVLVDDGGVKAANGAFTLLNNQDQYLLLTIQYKMLYKKSLTEKW